MKRAAMMARTAPVLALLGLEFCARVAFAAGPVITIEFVSAQPELLIVRDGGAPAQSILTFRVLDAGGQPVPDVTIGFTLILSGRASVVPQAISDAAGIVQTTLTSGPVSETAQVAAFLPADTSVAAFSAPVVIDYGVPSAGHLGISAQTLNIAGRVIAGLRDTISISATTRFGNPVAPGTVMTVVSDFGEIVDVTPTDSAGIATAVLRSAGPPPPNGIVTILAFVDGQKDFADFNGDGRADEYLYSGAEPVYALAEPLFDQNRNGHWDPGEPFVDLNGNQVWDADQEPVGEFSDHVVVWANTQVTFSGPAAIFLEPSTFVLPELGSQILTAQIADDLGNPLAAGTPVTVEVAGPIHVSPHALTIADGQSFNNPMNVFNRFSFLVFDTDPGTHGGVTQPVAVTISVTGANGNAAATAIGMLVPEATPTPAVCPGDCDGNGSVTVTDLIAMITIALGDEPLAGCVAGDADGDGVISIAELVEAVGVALSACGAG